ncbi:MAG: Hsp20/alpha crystallin family protein, partial [Vulcanimicrobiaceae bacterium]
VPGFKPDDSDITLENDTLTVSGKSEKRSFTRSLLLPEEIDSEKIAAKVEHGLLTLNLKLSPKAQPKKIAIHG